MELGYALSGLLVGFIVGLTGVGGGSLMTPLLVLVMVRRMGAPLVEAARKWRRE
jgi:uncharacterized membrane protein YfcA